MVLPGSGGGGLRYTQTVTLRHRRYFTTKVMTSNRLLYSYSFVFVLINSLFTTPVMSALCEDRCESGLPNLKTLRVAWHTMSKRLNKLNKKDFSFNDFVSALVAASRKYYKLRPLKEGLIGTIDDYRKCVKACEHQHSKRTFERTSDTYVRPAVCLIPNFCL